jgi:hypothetical protein
MAEDPLILDNGGFSYINPATFHGAFALMDPIEAEVWQ